MREFRGSHPYERVRLGVDIQNLLEITVIHSHGFPWNKGSHFNSSAAFFGEVVFDVAIQFDQIICRKSFPTWGAWIYLHSLKLT